MSRRATILGFLAAFAILATAIQASDPPKEGGDRKEVKGLAGKWSLVSAVIDGGAAGKDEIADRSMTFDRDTVTLAVGKEIIPGVAAIDGSVTPARCDITYERERGKKAVLKGICKVEGDTLTLCYEVEGKFRPTAFESKKSSGLFLETFKRAK